MTANIDIRGGSIYLSAAVMESNFPNVGAVIVIIRNGRLMILPVHQATSGGYLLKQRNAAGDRVADTRDVLLEHDLAEIELANLPATWDADAGALCVELPDFPTQPRASRGQ